MSTLTINFDIKSIFSSQYCVSGSQLNSLRERLSEAEAERDRLLAELEDLKAARASGVTCESEDGEDLDDMLDFPGEH